MKIRSFAVLLLCLVPACGTSDPTALTNEARSALASGKYEEAAKSYEQALAALGSDTSSPAWKLAKLGLIQARVRIDAPKAKDEFLQLAAMDSGKITDSDFNTIAGQFGDAGKFSEAIDILKAGKAKFPESKHLDELGKNLEKSALQSGDKKASEQLRGLGYGGGGDE